MRGVDRAEPAGAEPGAEPVATEHRRGRCRARSPGARPWPPSKPCSPPAARPAARLVALVTSSRRPGRSYLRPDRVLLRRGRRAPYPVAAAAPRCGRGCRSRLPDAARAPRCRGRAGRRRHPAARVRGARLPQHRQGERAQGLQPRGLVDRERVEQAGRDGVLPAARRGRQRVAAGPPDRDLGLPGPGRPAAQPGARRSTCRTRCAPRPGVAADRARVAPRRAGLHRRADPHRARRLGRRRRRGDPADRGPDAGLPRLRRRSTRRACTPFIKSALDETEIGGQEIAAARASCRRSTGCSRRSSPSSSASSSPRAPAATRGEPTGPGLHGTQHRLHGLRRHHAPARRAEPAHLQRRTPRSPSSSPTAARTTSSTSRSRSASRAAAGTRSRSATRSTRSPRGASATAELALEDPPPLGAAVTIRVRVAPVPGEEKTDNNQAEYQAIFNEG